MPKSFVVYFHRNLTTYEIFYVGVGSESRPNQTLSRNRFWKAYVAKHGNPTIEVVEVTNDKSKAFLLERDYIAVLGRRGFESYSQLVNISSGGEGIRGHVAWNKGKRMSDQMRYKRSEYMKRNTSSHTTIEGRKTLSDKLKKNNPMRQPEVAERSRIQQAKLIEQIKDSKVIGTYYGTRHAAEQTGFDERSILRAIKGQYKQYKGFVWKHTINTTDLCKKLTETNCFHKPIL